MERYVMSRTVRIIAILFMIAGILSMVHHRIVADVFFSPNQPWWRCHGKLGFVVLIMWAIIYTINTKYIKGFPPRV